jgi:transcriptional regulator with XRE-family HTH domain
MEFKDWLKAEMEARELTPSSLAGISKVPQPTIFRILSGETKDPRTGTVKKLERALGAESPPLEAPPTEHQDLIDAWGYLLPGERQELLKRIKQLAAHNREAVDHFKSKPVPETEGRTVRVSDRRKGTVWFGHADRRKERKNGEE